MISVRGSFPLCFHRGFRVPFPGVQNSGAVVGSVVLSLAAFLPFWDTAFFGDFWTSAFVRAFLAGGAGGSALEAGLFFGSSDGWHGEKVRAFEENRTKFGAHGGYQDGWIYIWEDSYDKGDNEE